VLVVATAVVEEEEEVLVAARLRLQQRRPNLFGAKTLTASARPNLPLATSL